MRFLIVLFTVLTLAGCKDQMERSQADIKKGNPEGQQSRKKVESSMKDADSRMKKQDQ